MKFLIELCSLGVWVRKRCQRHDGVDSLETKQPRVFLPLLRGNLCEFRVWWDARELSVLCLLLLRFAVQVWNAVAVGRWKYGLWRATDCSTVDRSVGFVTSHTIRSCVAPDFFASTLQSQPISQPHPTLASMDDEFPTRRQGKTGFRYRCLLCGGQRMLPQRAIEHEANLLSPSLSPGFPDFLVEVNRSSSRQCTVQTVNTPACHRQHATTDIQTKRPHLLLQAMPHAASFLRRRPRRQQNHHRLLLPIRT
jgi:hypothetical protein